MLTSDFVKKWHPVRTGSLSFQYNLLAKELYTQRRPKLMQRFVSKGAFFRKRKIKRYKILALSALVTKRIIHQQMLYLFSYKIVKWMRRQVKRLYKKETQFYSVHRGKNHPRFHRRSFWFKRRTMALLRMFNMLSFRREKRLLDQFIRGLPATFVPRLRKKLIIARIRNAMRPSATYLRWKQKQIHSFGPLYLEYHRPSQQWLAQHFQRARHRYKLFRLPLFSALHGYHPYTIRRRKRRRTLNKKGHRAIKKAYALHKEQLLRDQTTHASAISAELYLKYFYDYSITDLHKIAHRMRKWLKTFNIGFMFYHLNRRLDFLVRRRFCFIRMSVVRDVLSKGLVAVNGIVVKDPAHVIRSGQLISFGISVKDFYSTYVIGVFAFMFGIRNMILRRTLKHSLYGCILKCVKQMHKFRRVLTLPMFKLWRGKKFRARGRFKKRNRKVYKMKKQGMGQVRRYAQDISKRQAGGVNPKFYRKPARHTSSSNSNTNTSVRAPKKKSAGYNRSVTNKKRDIAHHHRRGDRHYRPKKSKFRYTATNYGVFNWVIGVKELSKCPSKKAWVVRVLKKKKAALLKKFLAICRKQRSFMAHLRLYCYSNIDESERRCVRRDALPIHSKYSGRTVKSVYYYDTERRKTFPLRIASLAIKLFSKHKKLFDSTTMVARRASLYNIVVSLTPTRLYKVVGETRYILLLRYRTIFPYLYEGAYAGFEFIRFNPILYRRRGCLVYDNSPPKVAYRDRWFRINKIDI